MDDLFDFSSGFGAEAGQEAPGYDTVFKSPHFTTINEPGGENQVTVSPKDLFHDPSTSAPPSTAFTNLTSPSLFGESPDLLDSFETSPLFTNSDDFGAGNDAWYPLFPGASGSNDESPPSDHVELNNSSPFTATVEASSIRRKSSAGQSPSARGAYKHSSISGVNPRKRDKPLPPIVVEDPNDTTAMKRARNTAAARKSRQKKVQKFEELEKEIEDLKAEVDHWKTIALGRNDSQV